MESRAIGLHAETVRSVLALLGPRPRTRLALMLQALGLSAADADQVIAHALMRGSIEADPEDPGMLRAARASSP